MSSLSFGQRVGYGSRVVARVVLILGFVTYAVAKFTGAQFVVPGYLMDTPVADLSGMDLTWAFFAYSPLYSGFVAGGQLVAAALLAFDRTVRLGGVLLLPITSNIVLVNIGYQIGTDTLILSLFLLALNLYLVADSFTAFKKCFWDDAVSDSSRPHFVGSTAGTVVCGMVFLITVVGIFWIFTSIMDGPAGGQKVIAGDWLVESASVDGRPVTDPAIGANWLWMCFDPSQRFSVRTTRGMFQGKYTVDPGTAALTVRYDPVPLPPVYPGQRHSALKISEADERRCIGESLEGFQWPVELTGTFRKEGHKLLLILKSETRQIEWVLTPYTRPKF